MMMLEDKYVGLGLAIASSLAMGISFVITKKGLMQAGERHGFEGDGFVYLRSPMWWAGIGCLVLGEACNFAAYAFAPAILVTPLGALAVLIGAVLGSYYLGEEMGTLGKLGSATCLIGAVIIVLHAPPDEEIQSIEQILEYALQPGFLLYVLAVSVFAFVMIYKVSPAYGKKNPLIFLGICSAVGSVSVMAVKAFGIALKLTVGGNNQFSHPSTYVFMIITLVCALTQMNYFNKALSHFPTNIVNPLYYVTFTTATLCASFILFSGFNTTDAVGTLSLLCGFLVTFTGVYLLNLSRGDPDGTKSLVGRHNTEDITGTDMISSFQTRISMETRRSLNGRSSRGGGGRSGSVPVATDREGLMRAYDEEAALGLHSLADDESDAGDDDPRSPMMGRHEYHHKITNGTGGATDNNNNLSAAAAPNRSASATRNGNNGNGNMGNMGNMGNRTARTNGAGNGHGAAPASSNGVNETISANDYDETIELENRKPSARR